MEEYKWSAKKYTAVEDIAKEIIISNIIDIKDINISLSGSVGGSTHLFFKITYSDNGIEKISYKIPEDIQPRLEKDPETMIEFAVGYIAKYVMMTLFRIKIQEK